jgi:hypothetical protein
MAMVSSQDPPIFTFSPERLGVEERTIEMFLSHAVQFLKQEQEEPFGSPPLPLVSHVIR